MFSEGQFVETGEELRQLDEARSAYPTGG